LVVVALLFVCYALAVYHWRRRAIVRRLATKVTFFQKKKNFFLIQTSLTITFNFII